MDRLLFSVQLSILGCRLSILYKLSVYKSAYIFINCPLYIKNMQMLKELR